MTELTFTDRALRDPWRSKGQRFRLEPPAKCEGLHCRPAAKELFVAAGYSEDEAIWALAEATDVASNIGGAPEVEVSERLWRALTDQPLSTVPIDAFHAHLVVWGEDPEAGPWYYALPETP